MQFRLNAYVTVGLFFLIVGQLVSAGTLDQNKPEITIFVYNTARVSPRDLALAQQQATMIFRQAGIATAWVDCTAASLMGACQPAGPGQFIVHIVARGKTSSDAVFGLAFLGTDGTGKYSDVFYDRIEKMHRDSGASPARLLGTVAAHEIGHLLLGSQSHSAMGVMSARWRGEEMRRVSMGGLRFTSEQASRMRARIDDWQRGGDNLQVARTGSSE
jgi:hypothetical protein